ICASRWSFASRKASKVAMNSSKAAPTSADPPWPLVSGAPENLASVISDGSFPYQTGGAADRFDQPQCRLRGHPPTRLDGADARLGQHREGDDGDFPEVDLEDAANAALGVGAGAHGAKADRQAVERALPHQRMHLA